MCPYVIQVVKAWLRFIQVVPVNSSGNIRITSSVENRQEKRENFYSYFKIKYLFLVVH